MVHLSHSIVTLIVLVHLCMDTVSPEGRIFKGRRVEISEFPFFVIIHYALGVCGGSIISPLWIATARHCFTRTGWISDPFINIPLGVNEYVYAGSDLVNISTMLPISLVIQATIVMTILHPNHDIALVRLEQPIALNETIQRILLPRKEEDEFTTVTAIGFGSPGENETMSPFLKASQHNFQESNQCFEEFETYSEMEFPDSNFTICVARKGGEGICPGDSGGPLVARRAAGSHVLAGIAMSGSTAKSESGAWVHCSALDSFSFFVRTSSHLDWIYSIAGENLSH